MLHDMKIHVPTLPVLGAVHKTLAPPNTPLFVREKKKKQKESDI